MTDLLSQLEAATEGSRDLDIEIAWYVGWDIQGSLGQSWRENYPQMRDRGHSMVRMADNYEMPRFSTNLQDAVSLVPEGWLVCHFNQMSSWITRAVRSDVPTQEWWFCDLYKWQESISAQAHAPTAPLALCIAIIKAHESKAEAA